MPSKLFAGAAVVDISPLDRQFLFGYPHVERYCTGVHDPLLGSALYLSDGETDVLLIANDVALLSRQTAERVRRQIEQRTGVSAEHILLSATHTHSGPITVDMLSNEADPVVPPADPGYVAGLEQGMVAAAEAARQAARPAEIARVVADGSCVGTNRHDPGGPADPEVPVFLVRDPGSHAYLAAMLVCSMHPTVLHEDSTLVSADFPGMTRQYLQEQVLGDAAAVLHHTGPAGNQSPRHVTRGNTFDEARRLGHLLGSAIRRAMVDVDFRDTLVLRCRRASVDLPLRRFPGVGAAQARLETAARRLDELRRLGAPPKEVRTAECDWFGAEEELALARAAAEGRVEPIHATVSPAEVMLVELGPWKLVAWPGEVYVEFGLEVKARSPDTYVISLAGGETQGYLVTEEAVRNGWYEAGNALLASPESGRRLVGATLGLLGIGPLATESPGGTADRGLDSHH